MAQKLNVDLPEDLDLPASWTIRITAVDASGNTVTAVNVSNLGIIATDVVSGDGSGLIVGPFMLVPGPGA